MTKVLQLRVWGEHACFTRPEFKSDRVTYDFLTPSAAVGCLEAIFWKPEMRWVIESISVLNPIRHQSIVTNELKSKSSYKKPFSYSVRDDRTQRHSLILKDPSYIITAHIELSRHSLDPVEKYEDIFSTRLLRGEYYHAPFLGQRQYMAFFDEVQGDETPINHSDDYGLVLHHVDYIVDPTGEMMFYSKASGGRELVRGRANPKFFNARMERGVVNCC